MSLVQCPTNEFSKSTAVILTPCTNHVASLYCIIVQPAKRQAALATAEDLSGKQVCLLLLVTEQSRLSGNVRRPKACVQLWIR